MEVKRGEEGIVEGYIGRDGGRRWAGGVSSIRRRSFVFRIGWWVGGRGE